MKTPLDILDQAQKHSPKLFAALSLPPAKRTLNKIIEAIHFEKDLNLAMDYFVAEKQSTSGVHCIGYQLAAERIDKLSSLRDSVCVKSGEYYKN
jgi:hypothetical protein